MTQTFNINSLIQRGKELVFEYELPVGTVYYRPLTDLEMDEAETYMLATIVDSNTRKYIAGLTDSADVENIDKVDFNQIMHGNAAVAYHIVLTSIKDFAEEEITIDDIKLLPGIKGLVEAIRTASGYDDGVIAEIEDFRKDE